MFLLHSQHSKAEEKIYVWCSHRLVLWYDILYKVWMMSKDISHWISLPKEERALWWWVYIRLRRRWVEFPVTLRTREMVKIIFGDIIFLSCHVGRRWFFTKINFSDIILVRCQRWLWGYARSRWYWREKGRLEVGMLVHGEKSLFFFLPRRKPHVYIVRYYT